MSEAGWVRWEGRLRTPPALVLSSPLLPLPVELVPGGDGRPVSAMGDPSGLGGSGSLGRSGGVELEEEPRDPMKMAETGRCLRAAEGREVI